MVRVLFIGDIVGRLGRATIKEILPSLKKRRKIDLCIANGENLAGGRGLTKETVEEVISYGVDLFTGGDHTFWRKDFVNHITDLPVLRCANLLSEYPGYGFIRKTVGKRSFLVISLLGTASTFIKEKAKNPFVFMEGFLKELADNKTSVLVDFHAEATSEKVALGWFLDGRVAALVGTHTHVPTTDVRILPKGTAFVTDLGMTGSSEGVLGVKREIILERFLGDSRRNFEWVEKGRSVFNSVLVEVDEKTGKSRSIERVDRTIEE
ncbi:MAG: YmdB family metallophosphoesterase [Patescibacteria group bacterium]|nr:YmdB family metallophosphoesterase [Patescibacteria group bacterium]